MNDNRKLQPPQGVPVPPSREGQTPQQETGSAVFRDEAGRMHVHSSYIWLGSLRSALLILFSLFVAAGGAVVGLVEEYFADPGSGDLLLVGTAALVIPLVLVIFGLAFLYRFFSYKNLFFELTDDEFNLYSGILNKKRVHVPYYRVQSVDQNASLLNRVLGICTVKIDTAGGASNKAIMVPYITTAQAEWLRTELFARKLVALKGQGEAKAATASASGNVLDKVASSLEKERGVFGGEGFDLGTVSQEYGLTNKELFLTGMSNSSSFAIILLGLIAGVGQLVGLLSLFVSADDALGFLAQGALERQGFGLLLASLVLVLALVLVLWLLSGVTSCVSYGGFKARRRVDRIEVEYGLLQHHFQGVNVDRVQSLTVKQSFIRRLFGYCEISVGKIDSAERSESNDRKQLAQGMVIHPFVKVDRVPEIIGGLLPEFKDLPADDIGLAPVALRRALLRRSLWNGAGFWTAVFGGVILGLIYLGASSEGNLSAEADQFFAGLAAVLCLICVVLLILDIVSAVLWFRGSSFGLNDDFAQVTNAGLTKESIVFPRRKIQFASTSANPFQRHAGVVTLVARTAAGVGGTSVSLRDVSCGDGSGWLDWNLPRSRH